MQQCLDGMPAMQQHHHSPLQDAGNLVESSRKPSYQVKILILHNRLHMHW
jgi:hypothetical protein